MKEKSIEAKARRDRLEAQGLCFRCGRNPARPGRKDCEVCAKKHAEAQKRYLANMPKDKWDEYEKRIKFYARRSYYGRKERGLCVICGGVKTGKGTRCENCRRKRNESKRIHHET